MTNGRNAPNVGVSREVTAIILTIGDDEKMTIKIYLANLGKYNEGELVGSWFTLPLDEIELNDAFVKIGVGRYDEDENYVHGVEINGVCYEEYAIHDYEAPFKIGEYDSLERLNEIAERLDAISEDDEIVKAVLSHCHDVNEALDVLEDGDYIVYSGCNDMSDVAYEYIEQTGMLDGVSDTLQRYFDYDAFGRDMGIEGTFISYDGGYIQLLR